MRLTMHALVLCSVFSAGVTATVAAQTASPGEPVVDPLLPDDSQPPPPVPNAQPAPASDAVMDPVLPDDTTAPPPATATPAQPAPEEDHGLYDDLDDVPPAGQEAEPAAPMEPEPAQASGNNMLAAVVGGGAACLAIPVLGCVVPLVGFIPVIGWFLSLVSPLIIGAGVGVAGWLGGSLAGKKRIPLLWPILLGMGGIVLTNVLTVPLYWAATGMAYLGFFGYLGSRQIWALVAGYCCAAGCYGLGLLVGVLGYSALAAGVGVLVATTGRGLVPGESAISWDIAGVPDPKAPGLEDDEQEASDRGDQDDRPRSRSESDKPRKRRRAKTRHMDDD